jgi:hypothetical protein
VTEPEEVSFRVPPLVTDGALFELAPRGLTIHNLYLRVWARVAS